MSDPTKGSDYLITVIKNADHTIERLERALAAAEDRIEAVEAERDELHRLMWRTKDTLIAAITEEADDEK